MDLITPAAERFGGVLPGLLRAPLEQLTGFVQLVFGPTQVRATLELPDLAVPYGERAARLGLEAFPLARNGSGHTAARQMIASVLASSAGAHRVAVHEAATLAGARVQDAGRHLDVVAGLIDPTLEHWVERWFGLRGEGPALLRTSRMIAHAMFFNPTTPKASVDVIGLERATRWVHEHRAQLTGTIGSARPGTLAAHLLAATAGDPDRAAGHLLGLTVGPLALGSFAIANAVDHLLRTPVELAGLAGVDDPRLDARQRFLGALGHRPPLPGVIRTNPGRIGIPVTGHAPPVELPLGPVLVATALALRCPAASTAIDDHLAFGHGAHRCLGPHQSTDIASVVLAALAPDRGHRPRTPGERGTLRPGPAPSAVRSWTFPGSLEVVLEPPVATVRAR